MKNNLTVIVFMTIFNTMVNFVAIAGEKIDKSLNVESTGEIEIHNNRGKIAIKGWEKDVINVKGELDDLTEKFVFSTNEGKTLLKVVLPDRNFYSRSGSGSNLRIFVPKGVSVQFGGIATDITISNLDSSVDISSVSGDITLKTINDNAYINSVSGDIELSKITGNLEISTVSGDVDAVVSSKKLSIGGVSSNIAVKTKLIESAKLSTVSGDASLHGDMSIDASVKLSNVSGESFYFAKSNLNARISLNTGPGGDIVNKYSDDKASSSFIGSEKLKFTAGNGEGLIRMSTVSGEIGIKNDKSTRD